MALASVLTFYTIAGNAQTSGDIYIRENTDVHIKAGHTSSPYKKCLHIRGGTYEDGLQATQWDCIRKSNVIWRLYSVPNEPGFYYIKVNSSRKCLQVDGRSLLDGARISQWQCLNQDNVKWRFRHVGYGYYEIRNQRSDKCLHVHRASLENNAAITQWTCQNLAHLQWSFHHLN
jgi:hypothetical protein